MNAGRSLSGDPPGAGCGLRFPARASGEPTGHTREGRGGEGPAGCPERAHSSGGRRTPAPCVTAPRVAAAHLSPGEAHPRGRRAGACGAAEAGREDWAPGALPRPLGAEPQAVRPGVGRHSALAPRAPTPVTALPGCCLRRPLKGSCACPTLAQLQPERTPQMQAVDSTQCQQKEDANLRGFKKRDFCRAPRPVATKPSSRHQCGFLGRRAASGAAAQPLPLGGHEPWLPCILHCRL